MVKKRRMKAAACRLSGQGMVEFAIVVPLFLMLLFGLLEFGFFFFVYSSVNSASREAVRYGSGAGMSELGVPYYQDCHGIREAAKRIGVYSGLKDNQIEIGIDQGPDSDVDWSYCPAGEMTTDNAASLGDRIVVRVSVDYKPLVGVLGFPPINVHSSSARTVLRDLEIDATPLTTPTRRPTRTPTKTSTGVPTSTPVTPSPTVTPSRTPTVTNTPKKSPTLCLTPIELGGCQ